jgi:hypothetical protein
VLTPFIGVAGVQPLAHTGQHLVIELAEQHGEPLFSSSSRTYRLRRENECLRMECSPHTRSANAPADGFAREILAAAESMDDDGDVAALREAKYFLLDFLMDGPKTAKEVRAAAREAGHTPRTIDASEN